MNNVYLCVGNYAKKPFYVNFSDISLYSVEELCYYFIDRIYLLDYDMMNQQLVDWIRTECGMTKLADELDVYVRKHVSVAAFVTTILESTGLYDENTIRKVDRVLKEQADLSPYERLKHRAEYLYRSGRFRQALDIYMDLKEQMSSQDVEQRAVLYYNIASVYAMDYAYMQAAEFYYESYKLRPDVQTLQMYILAKRKTLSDFDYGVFMRENPEWQRDFDKVNEMIADTHQKWMESKEKQKLDSLMEEKDRTQYHQQTGELILALKQDYRRQTM